MASTTLTFDLLARDHASSTFQKFGRNVDQTSGRFRSLGTSMAKFGKAAAVGLGVAASGMAVGLLHAAKAAAADEAAQVKLARALKNTTGANASQVSAVEQWITAQGRAFGVSDDQMRPALERLARSTHDVGEAQDLTRLAMDASAGTGKSLQTIVEALAKAHDGNTGALSRLGIQTKNAKGETLSFTQIVRNMGDAFEGQAAAKADTLQGKMDRLRVVMNEAKETIGAALIPALTRLATVFVNDVAPAITQMAQWINANLIPGLKRVAQFVSSNRSAFAALGVTIAALSVVMRAHAAVMAVQAAGGLLTFLKATKLVTAATKAYAAVQWLLNAALAANPIGIVITALAAVGVALVIAYKKSQTFRRIVNGAFSAVADVVRNTVGVINAIWSRWGDQIKSIVGAAFRLAVTLIRNALRVMQGVIQLVTGVIRGDWSKAWEGIKNITGGSWEIIKALSKAAVKLLGAIIRGLGSLMQAGMREAWKMTRRAASEGVGWVEAEVRALPGKIASAVGNLSGLLYNAGVQIIQGLISGITSQLASLASTLGHVTGMIPDLKGPLDRDRKLLRPGGQAIIEGLISGIEDRKGDLERRLKDITRRIERFGNDIKSLREARGQFVSGFAESFSTSVFGNDNAMDVRHMLVAQRSARDAAQRLQRQIGRLRHKGLSPDLVQQLAAAGPSAMPQISALAGSSRHQIRRLNRLNAATNAYEQRAASLAGSAVYADRIDRMRDMRDRNEDLADRIVRKMHGLEIRVDNLNDRRGHLLTRERGGGRRHG